jgi:hypothetical protein
MFYLLRLKLKECVMQISAHDAAIVTAALRLYMAQVRRDIGCCFDDEEIIRLQGRMADCDRLLAELRETPQEE